MDLALKIGVQGKILGDGGVSRILRSLAVGLGEPTLEGGAGLNGGGRKNDFGSGSGSHLLVLSVVDHELYGEDVLYIVRLNPNITGDDSTDGELISRPGIDPLADLVLLRSNRRQVVHGKTIIDAGCSGLLGAVRLNKGDRVYDLFLCDGDAHVARRLRFGGNIVSVAVDPLCVITGFRWDSRKLIADCIAVVDGDHDRRKLVALFHIWIKGDGPGLRHGLAVSLRLFGVGSLYLAFSVGSGIQSDFLIPHDLFGLDELHHAVGAGRDCIKNLAGKLLDAAVGLDVEVLIAAGKRDLDRALRRNRVPLIGEAEAPSADAVDRALFQSESLGGLCLVDSDGVDAHRRADEDRTGRCDDHTIAELGLARRQNVFLDNGLFDLFGLFGLFGLFDLFGLYGLFDLFDLFGLYGPYGLFDLFDHIVCCLCCFLIVGGDILRQIGRNHFLRIQPALFNACCQRLITGAQHHQQSKKEREYAFGQFVHLLRASYFLDVAADHAAALNVLLWSLLFSLCLGFSLCFGFCALVLLWVLPLVFFLLKCVAGSMLCSSPEVGVCAVAHFSLFSPL